MRIFIAFLLGFALLLVGFGAHAVPTLPTLPQATVDTTYALPTGGTNHTPANSAALAAILGAPNTTLKLGDTITLTAGTTYTGPFTLPNVTTQGSGSNGWIYIVSSALASLPAAGTRVAPANASNMPTITATVAGGVAIATANAAHHFRFVGIHIKPATTFVFSLVQLGNADTSTSTLPHHIIFDRCYLHGDSTTGTRRGIAMNGDHIAVIDSYLSDFKEAGDAQALWAYNGQGPFKIYNNYLEASTENMLFGGAEPPITNLVPSDITIQRNHFYKPTAWNGVWAIKNLLEFKNARRVLVEGNIFENSWAGAQNGFAIVVTPRNENSTAPWETVEDLTIRYNKLLNVGQGIIVSGTDSNWVSGITNRVLIEQNLIVVSDVLGVDVLNSLFFLINNSTGAHAGPYNVTIRHNTGIILEVGEGYSMFLEADGDIIPDFSATDNLLSKGAQGVKGFNAVTNWPEGTTSLNNIFTTYTFTNNAIIGSTGTYPPGNFFPANNAAVKFVDFNGGNYRLAFDSPHKAGAAQAASDGTDLGANIDAIENAIGGASTFPAPQNLRFK